MSTFFLSVVLASSFFPDNFWLLAAVYLGGCALVVVWVLGITARLGASRLWVAVGTLLGVVIAARLSVGLLPAGAAVGSTGGLLVSLVLSRFVE